jgi:hypothetical protein
VAEDQQGLAALQASDPTLEALDTRLAAVAMGEAPKGNAERLRLAYRACETKDYRNSTLLFGEALEAEPALAAWSDILAPDEPKLRAAVAATLRHWQQDPDLTGVRDPEALAKLPDEEQQAWRALWADVDLQLKKAQGH